MNKELTHAEKLRLNGIRKFGSESAWREAQANNGRKGGVARVPKGVAHPSHPFYKEKK